MKRLTASQRKVLDRIKEHYQQDLANGLEYHKRKLEEAKEKGEAWEIDYHKEELEYYEQGFISWAAKDSSVLESLQNNGYIDYEHGRAAGQLVLDWVRLK